MSSRAIFLPGTLLLFCAFILSLIVSVSLPALPTADIARIHFTSGASPHITTDTEPINQIRVRHILNHPILFSLPFANQKAFSFSFSLAFGEQ